VVCSGDHQLTALRGSGWGSELDSLLDRAWRYGVSLDGACNRRIGPAHSVKWYATYRHIRTRCIGITIAATPGRCGAKAVVPCHGLLVVWSDRPRGSDVAVVVNLHVTQR